MAKSGKARRVSVLLLAALVVAVSLHAAHSVTPDPEVVAELLPKVTSWIDGKEKLMKELKEKADEFKDRLEVIIKKFGNKDMKAHYLGITDVKVRGKPLQNGDGVVLFTTIPFPFFSKASFGQLRRELPNSSLNQFKQPCYPSGTELPPVTLVLAVNSKELDVPWTTKEQDGSMCLGILQAPWA